MLVYSAKKEQFLKDVELNQIQKVILSELKRRLFHGVGEREVESWRNSMQYMYKILRDSEIPVDAGVSIEYQIPLTGKRVDFILTGRSQDSQDTAVIIELKQWSQVSKTHMDGVVTTWLGKGETETSHPSYQAWTYAALIEDYNQTVQDEHISLIPCAYLHNLDSRTAINDAHYSQHTDRAPVFISQDADKLAAFLKSHVKYGDSKGIMYRIDHGRIKPSKSLADSLVSMISGNQEFRMIDDQKIVYETAIDLCHKSRKGEKHVVIVDGGPGTGKSVVAINLLVELTRREMTTQYITRNAAPREVYQAKLTGTLNRTRFGNLFRGSGAFANSEPDVFDALIVDEAHRLNEKSGIFSNLGENQIKELISASKFSIYFLDEDQRVTFKDIGDKQEIQKWAELLNAKVHFLELQSQFRCNGSDGYIAWLDNALQIRTTANENLQGIDYEFKVFESVSEMRDAIYEKNLTNNKSRLVAGYCWDWKSKSDPKAIDIEIPQWKFSARWNLPNTKRNGPWIMAADSVNEVGCIHTCQGLELDYVGVIVGPDFVVRSTKVQTDGLKRSKMDASIKGFKTALRRNPDEARKRADSIIKNTYRTLMSRGMKGCYIYCVDKETSDYFRKAAASLTERNSETVKYPGLTLVVLTPDAVTQKANAVPLYDLRVAAGGFSEYQLAGEHDWVELPEPFQSRPDYFVTRVIGESMNKRIPNGTWCLFKRDQGGTREGKIVLVEHRELQDTETGGWFTVKRYHSEKLPLPDGSWQHSKIRLMSESSIPGYEDIVLHSESDGAFTVIGEYVAALG